MIESCMVSAGVRMSLSRAGVHRMPMTVRNTPPAAAIAYALCSP